MTAAGYELEHFYYGQFVREGKPDGDLRLLATSPGLTQDWVQEALATATIPPQASSPVGSWALVRGKTIPFVMVQSQLTEQGAAMLHFILIPVEVQRGLGGNIRALMSLLQPKMPIFDRLGDPVPKLLLPAAGPPHSDRQIDAMLALMTACQDKMDRLDQLLAAIIQGVQIVVRGAPNDPRQRADFVEGLLALLPPPARFGVTFTMHSLQSTRIDAQIRFTAAPENPEGALIYDWPTAGLSGNMPTDDYSRFIVSQLRLDTELVVQQTNALTAVAAWRIKRGDNLAEALKYASYRLKLDDSLQNNLPVDAEEASNVLAEDPTLNDELRIAYARHIMAFALALGDLSNADPLAVTLRQQPSVEQSVLQQLSDALQTGKAQIVYDALARWMANPVGPRGENWIALVQSSALVHMNALMKAGSPGPVGDFLEQLQKADPALEIKTVIPKLIELSLPSIDKDPTLGAKVLSLGFEHLNVDQLKRVFSAGTVVGKLPDALKKLMAYINREDHGPAPTGLLARAAHSFGPEREPLVLTRLAELALTAQRQDLIDTPSLAALAAAAATPVGESYNAVYRWVVNNLSTDELLPTFDDPGPRHLLQILLARQAYPELAYELLRHQRLLYQADKQGEYALMVRRLFAETPLKTTQISNALRLLNAGGVKPLPLAMAHLGALKQANWSVELKPVVTQVTALLFDNRSAVEFIPPASLMELLDFHIKQRDSVESIRAAGLLPLVVASRGENGAALMAQMFRSMDWDKDVRLGALEVLRRYIRTVDEPYLDQALARMSSALPPRVRDALRATYMIRMMMGGEDVNGFAMIVRMSAQFLKDTSEAYIDKRGVPHMQTIISDMDSLSGGLNDNERRTLAHTMMNLGRAIAMLGRQHRQSRPRDNEKLAEQVIAGEIIPKSGIDVLRVMAGYFSRGKKLDIKLERPASPHPLGDRSAPNLMWESQQIAKLLRNLIRAVPPEDEHTLEAGIIRAEIESLWGDISLNDRRNLVRDLAYDLQTIPLALLAIYEGSDPKVLEDNNSVGRKLDTNKQQPTNALEFYRFVQGYFKLRLREK